MTASSTVPPVPPATRPASLIATCDQWARAAHDGTAIDGDHRAVTLGWSIDGLAGPGEAGPCLARGLATDRLCRIYRATATNVERVEVGATAGGVDYAGLPEPTALFAPRGPGAPGPFATRAGGAFGDVAGIAVDEDDRLYVADAGRREITVVDLWSRRVLRRIATASPAQPNRTPGGLAAHAGVVWAAVVDPAGLLRLTARDGPEDVALPEVTATLPAGARPARVAVRRGGEVVVLWVDGSGQGWLIAGERPARAVGPAADIAVDHEGVVLVAGCPATAERPADPVRRVALTTTGWAAALPLDVRGDDGSGLVVTTDGRVGYWTVRGFRLAIGGRVRYRAHGTVVTYRLDSRTPRNRWGRLLLEACVPTGTDLRVAVATTDDPDDHSPPIARTPATPAACEPHDPATSPAMPPPEILPAPEFVNLPLHQRRDHPVPWWQPPADDPFQSLEAPISAPHGRYLWVVLRLAGDTRSTPMVRVLRAEHEAHTLLRRLPRVFSEDRDEADFLHRFLAITDSLLDDWARRAAGRDVLVDPGSTPPEALDWLAAFVGMVLDQRWPLAARRTLVAEATWLYRFRGTVAALRRYLEIYLGVTPVIVEQFKLRGGGGPVLGADPGLSSRSVLGAGFRVGGQVAAHDEPPGGAAAADAFATHAHRFAVLVPRSLNDEQTAVVHHVLDTERPAHTVVEVCTVDAGMRAGRGMHLGLSTIVGPTGGYEPTVLGLSLLGRRAIVGWPGPGDRGGPTRAGQTTRVG